MLTASAMMKAVSFTSHASHSPAIKRAAVKARKNSFPMLPETSGFFLPSFLSISMSKKSFTRLPAEVMRKAEATARINPWGKMNAFAAATKPANTPAAAMKPFKGLNSAKSRTAMPLPI